MRIIFPLFAIAIIILSIGIVSAEEINSRSVTSMNVTITKAGTLNLRSTSDRAFSNGLELHLSAPQYNGVQRKEIVSVEGPDEFSETADEWGNDIITLKWIKPSVDEELSYEIIYNVRTELGTFTDKKDDAPLTDYTKPDKSIMEISHGLKKDTDIETIFAVNDWVYRNIEYDLDYTQATETGSWVCENRRGTCDEYANLAISMLKNLGYNAWYAAGWAYSGKSWEPHAWVKLYLDDETVAMDPTWLEYPADATHIEFTILPDSNNTEYVRSEGSGYKIIWTKKDIDLEINEYKQENKTKINADFPDSLKGNMGGIISVSLANDGCFQGEMSATSCLDEKGESLVKFVSEEKTVGFCGAKNYDFYFTVPYTESAFMRYSCPVVVSLSSGEKVIESITIEGNAKHHGMDVTVSGSVVIGENVVAEVDMGANYVGYVHAEFNDESASMNAKNGVAAFTFPAPSLPGDYELIIVTDDGIIEKRTIKAVVNRILKIIKVDMPDEVESGDNVTINITVAATSNAIGTIIVGIEDEKSENDFNILANTRREFIFDINTEKSGEKEIIATVLTNTYQDGWTGSIEVKNAEKILGMDAKDILNMITDFFTGIVETIQNLFG